MRILAALALTGCAVPPPVVNVREARSDEYVRPSDSTDVLDYVPGCRDLRGDLAPELYAPLVTYLRAHGLDDYKVVLGVEGADAQLDDGHFMVIDPLSEIGSLVLAERHDPGGRRFIAEEHYCVHVVRRAGVITLVLEAAGSLIT